MNNKNNNTLAYILTLIPTIASIILTIVIINMTIQIQLNFNFAETNLLIVGIILKETSRILLLILGIVGAILLIISDFILWKATKGINAGRLGWGIFILVFGIILIYPLKLPLFLAGASLTLAGLLTITKNRR